MKKENGSKIANEIIRDYKMKKKYEEIVKKKWESYRRKRKVMEGDKK